MSSGAQRTLSKAQRRAVLPVRFRLGCWLIVAPLFIAGIAAIFLGKTGWHFAASFAFQALAATAYATLEIRSVTWLKKHGYWS